MCDDCQAYAHWLGRADELLDENGGTAIFQMTPAQLQVLEGAEQIRCMRLSERGLMRWYLACCNTPLGNTLASAKLPFLGILQIVMDEANEGWTPEDVLGPTLIRAFSRFGKGPMPPGAHPRAPLWFVLRSLRLLFGAWIRAAHKPSSLFDLTTGCPIVTPTIVTPEERERLRTLCASHRTSSCPQGQTP